jgi:hypothetical protein
VTSKVVASSNICKCGMIRSITTNLCICGCVRQPALCSEGPTIRHPNVAEARTVACVGLPSSLWKLIDCKDSSNFFLKSRRIDAKLHGPTFGVSTQWAFPVSCLHRVAPVISNMSTDRGNIC